MKEDKLTGEPCQTPLEDLRAGALKHYEEASRAIHHWNSFVESAIKDYTPKAYSQPTAPDDIQELQEIREWKKQAIAVMPDMQRIGKLIGVPLGQSVHDKIIPFLEKQQTAHYKPKMHWKSVNRANVIAAMIEFKEGKKEAPVKEGVDAAREYYKKQDKMLLSIGNRVMMAFEAGAKWQASQAPAIGESAEVPKWIAEKVLAARDANLQGDTNEVYHQLYCIADPEFKYMDNPWKDLEATTSQKEAPAQPTQKEDEK